ncbi:site-2 protease family protein [Methanothermobacter wolfeii]|uniref:Site-2 protease family protein n=1 Tax=Methanothermobacter wolfeii TaxID=145261 RepID=A0A9E7RS42_METWO|nr:MULTISPECIES: site-2 protease family protein [Methanothermobacter]MDI6701965.1 site-2 protease family protein [Methanothermobacter wolfeii]MDI6842587.1 site-2 protease family protein [Methanothermobacter wolfeii]NLM02740.1 site-2 protease family protein [Methanothermobacter wolfeii]QHN06729.1 site-2 protease family protein [Methanothermobacter sp. THM-1]UXH31271.1 site-2 protease family protein [Methanothermobacter wolfeii]
MVRFSRGELRDILVSMIVIAGVFAYVFSGRNIQATVILLPVTVLTVGLGFVLHEIAHKLTAIHYGFWAEYRLWVEGLILAVVTAYFGFVFAAPGAVYIHGNYIERDVNGKISIAGPLTNIALAIIFLMASSVLPGPLGYVAMLGYAVNSFLALFNLIPIAVLDGAKVFRWNPLIWLAAAAAAFTLTFNSMF